MKNILIIFLLVTFSHNLSAQKNKQVSIAFVNAASAYPFAQFGKLLTHIQHPGVEAGYSFNRKTKTKHDWYREYKLSYLYHRFVQHAILLYTGIGYRYRPFQKISMQAALSAGYLHSIPATAKLKLSPNGEYKNNKGIGRMQALAAINFGIGYTLNPVDKTPLKFFATYQQLLQMPFVKAYVPILPYNSLIVGLSIPRTICKKIKS